MFLFFLGCLVVVVLVPVYADVAVVGLQTNDGLFLLLDRDRTAMGTLLEVSTVVGSALTLVPVMRWMSMMTVDAVHNVF